MKAYTDLSQSKKLAEILSIESADMGYLWNGISSYCDYPVSNQTIFKKIENIPCWSLAALLDILPYPSLHKTFSGWRCDSYNEEGTSCILGKPSDNPIDACVDMILLLKERSLI